LDFLLTFWLCSIIFAARCVLYVKALEVTGVARACNYRDGPHKTPKAVPALGDFVFCNSNDNSTIGAVTAALLDDLMPTQHTQTFSLSSLLLAEEIVDTENDTVNVGGDTEHKPCAVDKSPTDAATPPAGDNAARNLSIDFAYALSLGCHKEEYYLLIHADGVEMLWCAPTTSRAQHHKLIQEFLNYSGIEVRSIRFDNAMEFSQSDHFKSWSKLRVLYCALL